MIASYFIANVNKDAIGAYNIAFANALSRTDYVLIPTRVQDAVILYLRTRHLDFAKVLTYSLTTNPPVDGPFNYATYL